MNEWDLIKRLQQGDDTAFKIVVETWQDMVYNTALAIVQNAEDAEDVAQETFVQTFHSVKSFKGESQFSTWLYRITISKAVDHLRKAKRKKRFALIKRLFGDQNEISVEPPDFQHPGVVLENKEHAAVLFAAIQRLPDNQKIAFTLNKIEGLSYLEISEVMNTSVSSVESLLHRAKTNLRKWLEDYYKKNG